MNLSKNYIIISFLHILCDREIDMTKNYWTVQNLSSTDKSPSS